MRSDLGEILRELMYNTGALVSALFTWARSLRALIDYFAV